MYKYGKGDMFLSGSHVEYFDLSREQRDVLATDIEYPDTNINTLSGLVSFKRQYTDDIIRRAIDLVIKNEQGLRLRVIEVDGEYKQYEVDCPQSDIPIMFKDNLSQDEIDTLIHEEARYVFQWRQNQRLRFLSFKSQDASGVIVTGHHSMVDGYSMVFIGKLLAEYCEEIYLSGRSAAEDTLPYCYTDFVERGKKYLLSERYKRDYEYWCRHYSDWNGPCSLKAEEKQSKSPAANQVARVLNDDFTKTLHTACRELSISPAVVFISAVFLLLHCKNPDKKSVDMGISQHNRPTANDKKALGTFANETIVSIEMNTSQTVREFFDVVRKALLKSYLHGQMVLGEITNIAKQYHPEATMVRDVTFSYILYSNEDGNYIKRTDNGTSETGTDFYVWNVGDGCEMLFAMNYRADVFTAAEANKIFDGILQILNDFVMNVDGALKTDYV